MAHLLRVRTVTYADPATGKRCPRTTPGAVPQTHLSAKWYGAGVPGLPAAKRVPLSRDRRAAERMLDDLVRRAERSAAGLPDPVARAKSLADHVAEFARQTELGLTGSKAGKPPTPAQARLVASRVAAVVAGCKWQSVADLVTGEATLAAYLRDLARRPTPLPKSRTGKTRSAQTVRFHLAAVTRFARWLARTGDAGVPADLFGRVGTPDPAADRWHARRALSPVDLARVLGAAEASAVTFRGLTGPDRAHVYRLAYATGFRARELSTLTPAHFDPAAVPMSVTLAKKRSKNNKGANHPLPDFAAGPLRGYLAGRAPTLALWPGTWPDEAANMLRIDLAAAGVPDRIDTPDGVLFADFHSLRHSFTTGLAAAGVGVKELQTLARHSDPRLTLGTYTHTTAGALADAVGRLAPPGEPDAGQGERLTAAQLADLAGVVLAAWCALFGKTAE